MKVAFAGVFAGHVADRVRARLRVPCEVTLVDDREIGDVDVLVSMAFTREMAAAAPRLRLVQVPGAGLDRIDRAALAPGTALANGILGYGRIGQVVARRGLAFDLDVLAIRRDASRPDPHGLAFLRGPAALDEVLSRANYLAITLALTPDTRGLIGARELALMKPTAMLVNVARGEVVDEDALYDALQRGAIAGAALDLGLDGRDDGRPGRDHRREYIHRAARGEAPVNLVP